MYRFTLNNQKILIMNTQFIRVSLVMIIAIFCGSFLSAQDIIERIDGKDIECKIIKIGKDEIVYTPYGVENPPEIKIDMSLVDKVTFETGYVYEKKDVNDLELYTYEETSRNALKWDMFSTIGGSSLFTYERLITHRRSIEVGLLLHGLGFNNEEWDVSGLGVEFGYKFLGGNLSLFSDNKGQRNALGSFYVKPEILLGFLNFQQSSYYYSDRLSTGYGALYLNGGAQMVIGGVFLVDLYMGIGPCFFNENIDVTGGDDVSVDLLPVGAGHFITSANFSIKGGIKVGFGFGDKLDAREIMKNR